MEVGRRCISLMISLRQDPLLFLPDVDVNSIPRPVEIAKTELPFNFRTP
jgi:hypothetical protein